MPVGTKRRRLFILSQIEKANKPKHACPYCGREFEKQQALAAHMRHCSARPT